MASHACHRQSCTSVNFLIMEEVGKPWCHRLVFPHGGGSTPSPHEDTRMRPPPHNGRLLPHAAPTRWTPPPPYATPSPPLRSPLPPPPQERAPPLNQT
jgi:hypothetical protein